MPSHCSEEHTSELQSHDNLVCRLLLEKKKTTTRPGGPACRRSPRRAPAGRAPLARRRPAHSGSVAFSLGIPITRPDCSSFFLKDPPPPDTSPFSLTEAFPI